jgi:hypothetical protein
VGLSDVRIHSIEVDGKDPILIGRLADGGGILSYTKAADASCFVHTLNTESGLLRKLHALRISPSTVGVGRLDALHVTPALRIFDHLTDLETSVGGTLIVRQLLSAARRSRPTPATAAARVSTRAK